MMKENEIQFANQGALGVRLIIEFERSHFMDHSQEGSIGTG
jgi:hypothetical protein